MRSGRSPVSARQAHLVLRVQPGARRNEVVDLAEGVLKVRVSAPARDGKANEALVELLTDLLNLPKGRIHILWGRASRDKTVAVEGVGQEEALRRLLSA